MQNAISDGASLLTWRQDSFAFAETYDDVAGRYKGLRDGQGVSLTDAHAPGLVVKPEVAAKQTDAERVAPTPGGVRAYFAVSRPRPVRAKHGPRKTSTFTHVRIRRSQTLRSPPQTRPDD